MEIHGANMLTTLPDSINSFSKTSRSTVKSLVRDMKLEKSELQRTINKLAKYSTSSNFLASQMGPFSLLDREVLVELFRDSFLKTQTYFTSMNGVGLALNSMVSVLSSEIEKVEKDIENLEIILNNYEFTSGKDDLYNFSYIERFNNLLGDYRHDGSSFSIPDRDNSQFPEDGNSFIDTSIGAFKFGTSKASVNVINQINSLDVYTNYGNYISTNSDPENLFNDNFEDSWNVTIKSPVILTSSLSQYSEYIPYDISTYNKGAQAVVDMSLTENAAMDTIRISPNEGNDLLLMQIVLFSGSDKDITTLLSEPISLSKLKELSFPKQMVSRIIFIFNQTSYTRSKPLPIVSELNSKAIHQFVTERIQDRRSRFSRYQDMVYWYFLRSSRIKNISKKKTEYDFYTYRFPVEFDSFNKLISEEIFANSNFGLDYKYEINKSPAFMSLIQNVFMSITRSPNLIRSTSFVEGYGNASRRMLDYAGFMHTGRSTDEFNIKDQFYNYPIVTGGESFTAQSLLVNESMDSYEYLFSLKSIEFFQTLSNNSQKACFVSQKIPTESQVVALKAKLDKLESVANATINKYDLKSLVSYELSISSVEAPVHETDWHPLVFNNISSIESEVVFFDISDYSAKLRFNPISDSIFLYKDGIKISQFTYSLASNKITLTEPALYSSASVFCVRYDLDLVQYNPREIDFAKSNLINNSVRTYGDATGEGQNFFKNDINNTVTLKYTPYVNQSLSAFSSYDGSLGTTFIGNTTGYSPVRVRLRDGSFAINLTNYTGRSQNVQLTGGGNVTFIQTGKKIIFNRNITEPFKVYYDYIPNSLRFRLVTRKNIPNSNLPISVDSVILKMKTLNIDPYYDKLIIGTSGR